MHSIWDRFKQLLPPTAVPATPTAAVLVPLYEDGDGVVRVIITKRPDHISSHAGQLAFPGGRIDPEDDGVVGAALREAAEEVGIAPEDVTVLGVLDPVTTGNLDMIVVPVVGRLDGRPRLSLAPDEVELTLEPPLEHFFDEELWRTEDWNGHELWFIEVEDEILWGATARMMRHLLEVIRG